MIDDNGGTSEMQGESELVPNDILTRLRSQEIGLGHTDPTDTGSIQKQRVE